MPDVNQDVNDPAMNDVELSADVVVVGGGPAGLRAALAAAQDGLAVTMLDAAAHAGGQIWRARRGVVADGVARALAAQERVGVRVLAATRVVMPLPGRALLIDGPDGAQRLHWRRLILATGARERLLPFPGWTLPGVFGAGGLQALAKGGWPVAGRRVVFAGTGPLLLAAAATLRGEGADVVAVVEEASMSSLARFSAQLLRHPRKGVAALRLGRALAGVKLIAGTHVLAAEGDGRVQRVRLASAAGEQVIECDALAAGWGLVPQTELAEALGCALVPRFGASAIEVDPRQRTSVDGVFAAGECAGVAGVEAALLQGRIAGEAAAHELGGRRRAFDVESTSIDARDAPLPLDAGLRRRLARESSFARAVADTFPVPADWAERLRDDTLVCRCEDVPWSALRGCADLRAAKLATRCGMGYCQGRLCHDALATIRPLQRLPVRAPLMPVALSTLLAAAPMPRRDPDDSLPTEEPLP